MVLAAYREIDFARQRREARHESNFPSPHSDLNGTKSRLRPILFWPTPLRSSPINIQHGTNYAKPKYSVADSALIPREGSASLENEEAETGKEEEDDDEDEEQDEETESSGFEFQNCGEARACPSHLGQLKSR